MAPQAYAPQPGPMPAWASAPQLAGPQQMFTNAPMPMAAPPPTATTTSVLDGWGAAYYKMIEQQEMQGLQQWFQMVDRDRSGTVEAEELSGLTFDGRPLGLQTAARLIRVFDKDRNGKLDFVEYCTLHKFIQVVRNAFINADADRSGRIEAREIFQALQQCGFNYLSFNTVVELMSRFDTTKRGLDWGEFLLLMAMIAHCRSLFEWNDRDRDGWITINQDQLIQLTAFLS
eukprot:TRINITY_DN4928_c0_g1_i1.p1 TRINITY_DN4928_c0_g1~~TRINITY_DN4928_c0_g1_i1.p1  ORF type:complete len:253 (-),score=50.26 TRINITY_DN4928_c0_g1_i1:67-756(-)